MTRTLFSTGVKILGKILSAKRTLFTPFMGLFSYKADKVSALSGQLIREGGRTRGGIYNIPLSGPVSGYQLIYADQIKGGNDE